MRSKLLIVAALLAAFCPHAPRVAAQSPEREARADYFDRAEDEEDLNRELWEYVKGTPYEDVLKYVAAAQARAARAREEVAELPGGWRLAPAGRQVELGRLHHVAVLYLAAKDEKGNYVSGRLALLNTDDGRVEREADAGYFPYSVRQVNGKLYVAVLGENRVRVFDSRLTPVKELAVGRRPQEMCVDGSRLYVVNTDSDELSVVDTTRDTVVTTARVSRPGSRFGAAPTSCAVAGGRVYVTLAGLNAVEVLDKNSWRQLGLVPVGWYPTKVLAEGDQLLVLNAKGIRARRPNPKGPQPVPGGGGPDYVLTLLKGSLSIIPTAEVESKRAEWTSAVEAGGPALGPRRGLKVPVRYVVFVANE